jgi:hypothetical protein
MFDHMCEPIPSTGLASSQLRSAHQDGGKTSLTIDLRADIAIFREVRDRYVNTASPLAGTTIQVPALAREGALLEVEAIALLPVKQPLG